MTSDCINKINKQQKGHDRSPESIKRFSFEMLLSIEHFFVIYFIFQRNNKHGHIIILLTWYGRYYRLLTFVIFGCRRVEAQRLAELRPYRIKSEFLFVCITCQSFTFHSVLAAVYRNIHVEKVLSKSLFILNVSELYHLRPPQAKNVPDNLNKLNYVKL